MFVLQLSFVFFPTQYKCPRWFVCFFLFVNRRIPLVIWNCFIFVCVLIPELRQEPIEWQIWPREQHEQWRIWGFGRSCLQDFRGWSIFVRLQRDQSEGLLKFISVAIAFAIPAEPAERRLQRGQVRYRMSRIWSWIPWNLSFRYISLYWSIHTKDESKRDSAFAFISGVNWPVQFLQL